MNIFQIRKEIIRTKILKPTKLIIVNFSGNNFIRKLIFCSIFMTDKIEKVSDEIHVYVISFTYKDNFQRTVRRTLVQTPDSSRRLHR